MTKCILPWIHLEATATGLAKPCCIYKEKIHIDNKVANLSEFSVREVWNSDYMNNLRKEFLEGKQPSGCRPCWEMESVGKKSKRQISNEWFSHHLNRFTEPLQDPVYLDLKLGTVCNLKCRSCSSFSSSKWVEDEIKLYKKPFNDNIHSYWIDEDSSVWSEIETLLPSVEYLDFTGGEPLLIKKHFEILRKCVSTGYSKNIKIHYNTNGTVMPTDEMFSIWDNFKEVTLMFSIDGVGEKFEYLRHPGKWKDLVRIFETALEHKNIYVPVCYSVSAYNVMYMNEFIQWFKSYNLHDDKLYFNLIFKPEYLNIQHLNYNQKLKIKAYLEESMTGHEWLDLKVKEVIDFMMKNNPTVKLSELLLNTSRVDDIRNESFRKTFPELYNVLTS
jgi:MoaA/NifB/PqqE/SkfB family radical SAM enzyme